jgi:hypothetical protein
MALSLVRKDTIVEQIFDVGMEVILHTEPL